MSYIETNLMPGESIIYKAQIHWIIFLPAIVFVIPAIWLIAEHHQGDNSGVFAGLLILIALVYFIKAFITKISTELAITSKRVIAKFGLIRRNTIELNHSKVESFNVEQSILGRLLGFGTIVVNGTGGGKTPIPCIDSPLDFRKNAMETIDQSQRS